jgi:glycosyltransferase involved in cell wall biosynthesis
LLTTDRAPSTPRVSVIIPAYNAEAYLAETLNSVLAQTYREVEILVCDDGSTDGTRQLVARYGPRVKYVHGKNSGGPARPRNAGIRASSGSLLAFIDADDVMTPDRIATQVRFLVEHREVGIVFSDYEEFGADKTQSGGHFETCPLLRELLNAAPAESDGLVLDSQTATELLLTENFGSSSPMVRRSTIERAGAYLEGEIMASEDFEFQFRAASIAAVGIIPCIHWFKRQHPLNMSANAGVIVENKIAVRRRILASEAGARRRKLKKRIAGWHADLAYFYTGRKQPRGRASHSEQLVPVRLRTPARRRAPGARPARAGDQHPEMKTSATEGADESRIRQEFAVVEELIGVAEALFHASRLREAAACAGIAAASAWRNHAGLFASPRLERLLNELGRRAVRVPPAAAVRERRASPASVLHVMSKARDVGGDSRLACRWMHADATRRHSVAITSQAGQPIAQEFPRRGLARGRAGALPRCRHQ